MFAETKYFYKKMKKFPTPLRKLFSFTAFALIFFTACKKMDNISGTEIIVTNIEDKFFNTHRTSDPREQV